MIFPFQRNEHGMAVCPGVDFKIILSITVIFLYWVIGKNNWLWIKTSLIKLIYAAHNGLKNQIVCINYNLIILFFGVSQIWEKAIL